MAQDLALFVVFFDLMLVPFFFLTGIWGAPGRACRRCTKLFIYTLVGSLLMLAAAIATGVLAAQHGRHELSFAFTDLAAHRAARGLAELDLPVLRRGVPGEDAALPAARLDARRLPRHAAAGARGVLGRAVEGRRLRLPAHRAAAVPRRARALPDADAADRAGLDPLRLGDGVHDDQGAADPRLLVGRPARLHHRSASSRCATRAPRARCCRRSTTASWSRPAFFIVALLAARAGGSRGHPRHGRHRVPRARARDAVPDRRVRDAGDAGLGELRRRVPDPARRLPGEDRDRDRRLHRRRAGGGLRAAALHPHDAQPRRAGRRVARDELRRRPRARPARARDPRARAVPAGRAGAQRGERRAQRPRRARRSRTRPGRCARRCRRPSRRRRRGTP